MNHVWEPEGKLLMPEEIYLTAPLVSWRLGNGLTQ